MQNVKTIIEAAISIISLSIQLTELNETFH